MGNKINKEIGVRIAKLRENRNLSQAQLAVELDKIGLKVRRESITQWENGTRDLKTEYTVKLADYFGVTCDYILRGIEADNISIAKETGLTNSAILSIRATSMCIKKMGHFTLDYVQNRVISLGYMKLMLHFLDYLNKVYDLNQCKKNVVDQLKSYQEPIPEDLETKIFEWAMDHKSSMRLLAVDFVNANENLNYALFKLQGTTKHIAEQMGSEINNG